MLILFKFWSSKNSSKIPIPKNDSPSYKVLQGLQSGRQTFFTVHMFQQIRKHVILNNPCKKNNSFCFKRLPHTAKCATLRKEVNWNPVGRYRLQKLYNVLERIFSYFGQLEHCKWDVLSWSLYSLPLYILFEKNETLKLSSILFWQYVNLLNVLFFKKICILPYFWTLAIILVYRSKEFDFKL